ncbi:hypothetical protein L1987_58228 [Smallanthus sonchifolius]|uniref:Uncharacterized protein n=1 Tax=Smallanthus sonchifolius TaxID=185202 RepID=A0ACB9DF59_9ASTR|nr:hypothetical protein L1987_58228 [Smallanthus sonchifolius]
METFSEVFSEFLHLLYVRLGILKNSLLFSKFLNLLIESQDYVLSNFILNIKDETSEQVAKWLRKGNKLCKGKETPMSPELIEKVRDIYERCKSRKGDTPLMLALEMRLMDMAWGFIHCAIQTNTDLRTGETGWSHVRSFLKQLNMQKKTALEIAIDRRYAEVARILWENIGLIQPHGSPRIKVLFRLLNEPENASTTVEIDRQQGTLLKLIEN